MKIKEAQDSGEEGGETWNGLESATMLKAIGHMLAYNTIAALEDDLSDEYKKEFILTQELQAEKATVAAAKTVSEL